jgi:Fe2+ or Zn2+ uptake regulation protein
LALGRQYSIPGENQPVTAPSAEQVRDLFRQCDLRCTRQRELVYAALAASKAHPTAEELYHTIQNCDPGLSLATVYNTLEAFIQTGITRRLPGMEGGPCRYDADTTQHVHAVTRDGAVRDVPADLSDRLLAGLSPEVLREIEARMGMSVARLNVQIEVAPGPQADQPN